MDPYRRLSIRPNFNHPPLPCIGKVGDLLVRSHLPEGEYDDSPAGQTDVWVCIKASWERDNAPAIWARLAFDGIARCKFPTEQPPQDYVDLSQR